MSVNFGAVVRLTQPSVPLLQREQAAATGQRQQHLRHHRAAGADGPLRPEVRGARFFRIAAARAGNRRARPVRVTGTWVAWHAHRRERALAQVGHRGRTGAGEGDLARVC